MENYVVYLCVCKKNIKFGLFGCVKLIFNSNKTAPCLISPLPPKATPLMRPEFRCSEIIVSS